MSTRRPSDFPWPLTTVLRLASLGLIISCGQDSGTGVPELPPPAPPRFSLTFDSHSGIYETDIDSVRVRLLVQDSLPLYELSWAPDGQQVAFTRMYWGPGGVGGVTYYHRVAVYNTVSGTVSDLTHGPDDSFQPDWSPDGRRVAYLSRRSGALDATLRSIRSDGTDDRPLGDGVYLTWPPDWSPDGHYVAATRNDGTVVIVDAATGRLVRAVARGENATWSPDGRRLAFQSTNLTITITDIDGSHPTVLPFSGGGPTWSPDGLWLAVQNFDIYVIRPDARDSSGIRYIARGSRPAWRLTH